MGSTGSRLAAAVLNDTVLGRGPQVGAETGLVGGGGPVAVIRPLRDVSDKEIALFNHFSGVAPVVVEPRAPEGTAAVTAGFLDELSGAGFPATVSTLLATAAKVKLLLSDLSWTSPTNGSR